MKLLMTFFSYWSVNIFFDCSSALLCLQDFGKEQKEEDILITPEDPPDVTVFLGFFANLPALIVRPSANQLHPQFDHITV